MAKDLREQFIRVTMRFKKIDVCLPSVVRLHYGEMAVMSKAFAGCPLDKEGGTGLNVSEIQEDLHISKPAVSQILNTLESKGYIVRTIDPKDRRKISVKVTPEGAEELNQALKCYEDALDEVIMKFGEEDTKRLILLLTKLIDTFDEISSCDQQRE